MLNNWLPWALHSACFAALTTVFAKLGVEKISVVLVALFGVWILGQDLSIRAWLGVGLITAGVVLIAFRPA